MRISKMRQKKSNPEKRRKEQKTINSFEEKRKGNEAKEKKTIGKEKDEEAEDT